MRIIAQFERHEAVKYISQLDMLRTIHRALRRADIPVAYSEGFNPQPRVSFGFALSVGLVSFGEYMDIVLKENMDAKTFLTRMNDVLPDGIRMAAACCADEKVPKIGKMIDSAEYEITISCKNTDELAKKAEDFFEGENIIIEKHSKKGISQADVKDWIFKHEIKVLGENTVAVKTVQSLSEQMSVRIDDLWNAMSGYISLEDVELESIIKKNTLLRHDGNFITPVEYTLLLTGGQM